MRWALALRREDLPPKETAHNRTPASPDPSLLTPIVHEMAGDGCELLSEFAEWVDCYFLFGVVCRGVIEVSGSRFVLFPGANGEGGAASPEVRALQVMRAMRW